jgi:hypothetical protein
MNVNFIFVLSSMIKELKHSNQKHSLPPFLSVVSKFQRNKKWITVNIQILWHEEWGPLQLAPYQPHLWPLNYFD